MYLLHSFFRVVSQTADFEVILVRHAILCGAAPKGMIQKKLDEMYDSLLRENGGLFCESEIVIFPNGVTELFLENVLNNAFDEAVETDFEDEDFAEYCTGDILLYFCARTKSDLSAELSESYCDGIEVVSLNEDEIRKDVIAYYENLAENLDVHFCVHYEADTEFVTENALGYEKIV